jgi:hypothetical protein
MSNTIKFPCPVGEVSDGFHTFNELYDHRCALFLCLMKHNLSDSWISLAHSTGDHFTGWFIAGMTLSTGKTITYHLPMKFWPDAKSWFEELPRAPKWDGHTSMDVFARLIETL